MWTKNRLWRTALTLVVFLVPGSVGAQVQRIELDIAGYLCGF